MRKTMHVMAFSPSVCFLIGVLATGCASASPTKPEVTPIAPSAERGNDIGDKNSKASFDTIAEKDMDAHRVMAVFRKAFFKAELNDDGRVRVEDGNMKVYVQVSAERQMLIYVATFRFKEAASRPAMLELVNRMNDNNIFVRAAVTQDNILWFDYFLPYEQGIPSHQVMTAFKWFSKAVTGALQKHDSDDIVQ